MILTTQVNDAKPSSSSPSTSGQIAHKLLLVLEASRFFKLSECPKHFSGKISMLP